MAEGRAGAPSDPLLLRRAVHRRKRSAPFQTPTLRFWRPAVRGVWAWKRGGPWSQGIGVGIGVAPDSPRRQPHQRTLLGDLVPASDRGAQRQGQPRPRGADPSARAAAWSWTRPSTTRASTPTDCAGPVKWLQWACHPAEPVKLLEDWAGKVYCLVCWTPAASADTIDERSQRQRQPRGGIRDECVEPAAPGAAWRELRRGPAKRRFGSVSRSCARAPYGGPTRAAPNGS